MAIYRLLTRGKTFYSVEIATRRRKSLRATDREHAKRLIDALNEAARVPEISYQVGVAYLSMQDPQMAQRTWGEVFGEYVERTILVSRKGKGSSTDERTRNAVKDQAFDLIRSKKLLSTTSQDLLNVLKRGGVATNVYLRRIHNWTLDMGWIPTPILARPAWPKVHFKLKRGITAEEHQKIMEGEPNPESRVFYDFLWETGAGQGDAAALSREDVNEVEGIIAFQRQKLEGSECGYAIVQIDDRMRKILSDLPKEGYLFPWVRTLHTRHRATAFSRRCKRLGIKGVSLHSYRYAWAERAKSAGYPERFAMEWLGHKSKAVHRSYAKMARVVVPSLSDFEAKNREKWVVVKFPKVA